MHSKGKMLWGCLLIGLLSACGGGGGGGSSGGSGGTPPVLTANRSVQISWVANRETAVNSPGGGYKVYYARTAGFDIATATVADAPYAAGATAPTSTLLTLPSGTHYIKIVAYSVINPGGSAPSAETSIVVP